MYQATGQLMEELRQTREHGLLVFPGISSISLIVFPTDWHELEHDARK